MDDRKEGASRLHEIVASQDVSLVTILYSTIDFDSPLSRPQARPQREVFGLFAGLDAGVMGTFARTL